MSSRVFDIEAMRAIGDRIRAVRGAETQEAFALRLGVSKGALSNYENGRRLPSSEILQKISQLSGYDGLNILTGYLDPKPILSGGAILADRELSIISDCFVFMGRHDKIALFTLIIGALTVQLNSNEHTIDTKRDLLKRYISKLNGMRGSLDTSLSES